MFQIYCILISYKSVILNLYCSSHALDSQSFWIHILTYLCNLRTPLSRVLLEKLTDSQLVKKFLHFMEPKSSLPCPYPEPDHSSPYPLSHFLKIHFNIILPSIPGSYKWAFSLRFLHQNPYLLSPTWATCPTHLIFEST